MNTAYYVRTTNSQHVIRVGSDGITLRENDFNHGEWKLETSLLSSELVGQVNLFCGANGISVNWTAMAKRCY